MIENPPIIKDVKEFKFKLKCRLKIFPQLKFENPINLLAAASKYGVIFAGSPNGVQCIRTDSVLSLDSDHGHSKNITAYPKRTLQLGVQPSHLSVSADNELLAVALIPNDCATLFVYSVASFGGAEIIKKCEFRLSNTPGVTVSDLQWNPGVSNMLAVVMADGSAAVIEFKDNSFVIVGMIPQNSQASCLCWSPKGKQVVIGAKNGSLTQYKPELKAVKTFPPPQLQGITGFSVISVHWLSNFQFIAAYRPFSDPARANLMVVNVPKNSSPSFINYEDFCFGSNTARPEHYFIHQPAWNMLIVGTTNSMDANILGLDGDKWVQWMLDDGGRAELPLTNDHQDVYNIGMCFDISPTQPVPIGENISVDPMPLLVMLSHDGVLCYFQAINLLQGAAKLCQPPQQFPDSSGLHFFSLLEAGDALSPNQAKEEQKVPDVKELEQQLEQTVQPDAIPAPQSMGKPVIGQATIPQSSQAQTFNINFNVGQQSFGQALNFNQPIVAPAVSQSTASPVSKFSLPNQASQGQTSFGQATVSQSLGGLGSSQTGQNPQQSTTFGSLGGFPQSMWSTESNQKTTVLTSKQSSPAQQNLATEQVQQTSYSSPQPNFGVQQSTTVPLANQAQLNFQPQQTSRESTPNVNQMTAVPITSQSILNQNQSNEAIKNSQFQSQGSTSSQPVSTIQPSNLQPEPSKPAPAQETVEESNENKLLKEMEVCQALLQNFSVEMEQKQAVIRFISSQTECNISESKLKDKIIQDIEKLRKFEEELKATGMPDQADVNTLGNSILEIFGWYEKIKAKERMVKNPGYIELMESQDLDPITKNYLNNIDRYVYYVESQIKQAKAKLSSMWDSIGSPNFEVPVMEVIYQSLVAQMNVLAAKKAIVDSCETKMKKISKNRGIRNSRRYIGDLELSTLAERLLDTRISDSDLPQDKSIRDASMNYIMLSKRMAKKNLNEDKVSALHQWHKNHKVITTKVTKKSAIVVNGDISKDETFYRAISPNKQSTPYLHTTPKKAISSIPRKSLFTLTSNMSNGNLENSQVNTVNVEETEEIHIAENKNPLVPVVHSGEVVKTSETNFPLSSLDPQLKNNLATSVSKVISGNKINSIQNTADIPVDFPLLGSSTEPNILSSDPGAIAKEPIPTPAFFKGVPAEAHPRGKESVISTSWGAQTPVFSQIFASSNNSNSLKTTLSSSKSIFSGGPNTNTTNSISSFPFNLNGNQPSSSTKSIFSQSNSVVSNPLASPAKSSPSGEKEINESISTAISAIYNPSNIKAFSSSTALGFATSTVNSVISCTPVSNMSVASPVSTSSFQINSSLTITPISANSNLGASFTLGAPSSALVVPGSSSASPVGSAQSKPKMAVSVSTDSSVTSSNQFPISSQPQTNSETNSSNISTEAEISHKPSAPSWSSVSSLIGSGTLTSSSSTTSASIFSGTSVFGSLKTPMVSSQSTFGSSPVFSSSAPPSRVFSSASATTNTNIFSTTTIAVTTSSIFGSTNTAHSSAPSVSTSDSVVTTSEPTSTSSLGIVTTASNLGSESATTTTSTTATSSFSVFPTSSSSLPLFGSVTSSTSTVTSSGFSSTPATTSSSILSSTLKTTGSIFGTATTSATFFGNTSIFGAPTSTVSSVFGGSNTTSSSSVFGGSNATTASSVFGGSNTATVSSVFGGLNTTTVSSVFGGLNTTTASPVFGGSNTTTASSVFGGTNTTTTSSIFGGSNTTSVSVFGGSNTTNASSVFGGSNTTNASSVFRGSNTTTVSSVFGGTSTTTIASSGFGASGTTTSSSLFGAANTTSVASLFRTTTTTTSVFGGSTTTATSVFGTTSTTTSPSIFGTSNATTAPSLFGSPSTTSTSSVFGTPSSTSTSIFGSSSVTTSSSVFGSVNTTSSGFGSQSNQGGSIFGAAAALSSTSFFGSPPATTSSFGNQSAASIFGGNSSFGTPSTTNSFFGSTTNVFGTTTATSTSSIFGGNGFQQKTSFGPTSSSLFGQTPSSGGNFGTSGGSLFGGTSSFGSPSTQGNIFQSGGTGNIFGAAANTSPFSGTGQAASQPTFGSPPSFQSAQRPFGTATPVFGGQSTFGAAPTFGGSPTFGSTGGQTFGSPSQHSSTFENLANQETVSFGNLAQQQAFPTTSFGGSSFSSWRS